MLCPDFSGNGPSGDSQGDFNDICTRLRRFDLIIWCDGPEGGIELLLMECTKGVQKVRGKVQSCPYFINQLILTRTVHF